MEPTPNFAAGLELARKQLADEKKLSERDDKIVTKLLNTPIIKGPDGNRVFALRHVHTRTRVLYAKVNRTVLVGAMDWTKLVEWLKEHWFEIVRIILTIVPFIL